jgi:hypothetical protein
MIFSSAQVAGKSMSFETGKMGRQAGGSVVSRTQDTMVRTFILSSFFFFDLIGIILSKNGKGRHKLC